MFQMFMPLKTNCDFREISEFQFSSQSEISRKGPQAMAQEWHFIDGPRDYDTKWKKSDRERQISQAITHMRSLKTWYN